MTAPDGFFQPQLGAPHHVAYVVETIEGTVDRLVAALGAGPFFLIENVPVEDVVSGGEPAEFAHHSAFGACGDGVVELVQPVRLAPERVERAFAAPRPRVHHVGYAVAPGAVADVRRSLDEHGALEYLSSRLGEVANTLHGTSDALGHDVEILVDNQSVHDFFGMVRAAADGWDGSDPLRTVEA